MKNGKILILTDGKAGHESQSRAFARALGGETDCVEIHFKSKLHKAFSYLLDRVGVSSLSLSRGLGSFRRAGTLRLSSARGRARSTP